MDVYNMNKGGDFWCILKFHYLPNNWGFWRGNTNFLSTNPLGVVSTIFPRYGENKIRIAETSSL